MNDEWLNKVHDRLADYEIDEPDNLWNSIESKRMCGFTADGRDMAPVKMTWIKRSLAAAALIAVILSLGLYYLSIKNHEPHNIPQLAEACKGIHDEELHLIAEKSANKKNAVNNSSHIKAKIFDITSISSDTYRHQETIGIDSVTVEKTDRRLESSDKDSEKNGFQGNKRPHRESAIKYASTMRPHKTRPGHLSVSLYGSGGTNSAFSFNAKGNPLVSSTGPDNAGWEDNPMLGILLFNQGKDIETEIQHHRPIRAGLAFSYSFNDRLAIESGISYANLTSDIKKGSDSHYYTAKQKLQYIGIPLNLKYRMFSWKRLDLYVSSGVLAEKCISAKLDKEYILNHHTRNSVTEDLNEKPMQWSVNASVGLQCNIISSMSLFVEPGISYYFKDRTDIQTIYKDKPTDFNLNLGLRFTFGKR